MIKVKIVSALWCPTCLLMRNRIDQFKQNHSDIAFEELDYDFDEDQVKLLNVQKKLPVFIVYQEETEIHRFVGERTVKELEEEII